MDARHCPRCGTRGFVDLGRRSPGDDGIVVDPVLVCPDCEEPFEARGFRFGLVPHGDPEALERFVAGLLRRNGEDAPADP